MIEHLIVPLDGGETSLRALACAAAFAKQLGVRVTALTVTVPVMGTFEDRAWLERRAASPLVDVEPVVVLSDDTVGTILEAAQAEGAVLCMSSHGRTGAGEVLLGSVSAEVVRRSTKPVLLVGPKAEAPGSFRSATICVSGDEASVEAAAAAAPWLRALGATPWVVTVVGGPETSLSDTPERCMVELAAERLTQQGFEPRKLVLCERDRTTAVLDVALRQSSCMVVTGARPRDGIERVVLGSMSRDLVRSARLPVLVVGPSATLNA
jgi:nucleotide-binding universal stress UspA family protein